MSGVEYSVSVRAKNGVSDMSLELRNASIVTSINIMTSTTTIMTSTSIMNSTSMTMASGSSDANSAPIIAGVVCPLVVIILLVAGIIVIGVML